MAAALFRRILVPHDFSDAADHALREAAALARDWHGELHVLHVVEPRFAPVDMPVPSPVDLVPGHQAALERRVHQLLGDSSPPVSIAVDVGVPADRILDEAIDADAIVMATHGRTGLSRFLIGSVAERVVRLSPIPVLTIRAEAQARTTGAMPASPSSMETHDDSPNRPQG
jgi:nucleotide-binding universal stress UspA family protein